MSAGSTEAAAATRRASCQPGPGVVPDPLHSGHRRRQPGDAGREPALVRGQGGNQL